MNNLINAFSSIWSNKARSFLTVLGVVIGVASVTSLISLGEGLKQNVAQLIQGFGTNVIVVVSGKVAPGKGVQSGPASFINGDILTLKDVETVANNEAVEAVTPLSLVSGNLELGDKETTPTIFGAYPNLLQAFQILKLDQGQLFATKASGKVVILGDSSREALFGNAPAVGRTVTLGQTELKVIGTFAKAKSATIFGSNLDSLAMIPFDTATSLNKNQVKIMRIIIKVKDTAKVGTVRTQLRSALLANHNNEEDFTVLTQDDILELFNSFLNLATALVSAIAAISLVVGGVGIMNIMLVVVTERTREIGLRKAVGATKLAIGWQFLIEALVITFVGALLGLGLALGAGLIVAAKTGLHPVVTPAIMAVAVGVSVGIGIIFGLWPAIRAANQDPIEALRYE